jgi:hypothetical protein
MVTEIWSARRKREKGVRGLPRGKKETFGNNDYIYYLEFVIILKCKHLLTLHLK